MRSSGPLSVANAHVRRQARSEDGAAQPGMDINPQRFDREFHIADAAQAKILHRNVAMVHAAEFPDAGIRRESLFVVTHEIMQMLTLAVSFFALNDEFDIAGQVAIGFKQGVNGV